MRRRDEAEHGGARQRERRRRIDSLAWLLDNSIRLPGGFRIGLDAVIGLVPVVGDAAGVLLSAYIVRAAAELGAPPSLLMRMFWNVAVEGVIGMVPVLGDLFDAAWKANLRNARLLARHIDNPAAAARSNRVFVGLLALLLILLMLPMWLVSALIANWVWHAVAT